MSATIVICLGELSSAADSFRLGMDAQGHDAFVRFVDTLEEVLTEFQSSRLAPEIAGMLPAIVSRQERGDMVGVADLLEHGLAPALRDLGREAADPGDPLDGPTGHAA